jgi:hypothetical protein
MTVVPSFFHRSWCVNFTSNVIVIAIISTTAAAAAAIS